MELILEKLTLTNFKNFEQAQLHFTSKINCFVGPNGAGKTNILDAIYFLSFTKSYFNITDSQAIRFGADFFALHGKYIRASISETIHIALKDNTKTVKRNDKKYKKLSQHIGLFPAVIITPEDTKLITGAGEERRKFLDIIIAQTDVKYLHSLNNYKRTLQQRNKLLKNFAQNRHVDKDILQLWDEQLSQNAHYIYQSRKKIIQELLPLVQQFYNELANNEEQVDITYKSHLNDRDLAQLLEQNLQRDLALQYTYAGIHRDDLGFRINGHDLKKYGSQGQQKSFLLSIKFAQMALINRHLNLKPILLLDDIFDKLDPTRTEKLVHLVAKPEFGQIFITHTNRERLQEILKQVKSDYLILNVKNGKIIL